MKAALLVGYSAAVLDAQRAVQRALMKVVQLADCSACYWAGLKAGNWVAQMAVLRDVHWAVRWAAWVDWTALSTEQTKVGWKVAQ